MHIISKKFLKEFGQVHPEAAGPLHAWHRIVESSSFQTFADLRHTFNSVDKARGYFVFNLGGNKFRLVAAIPLSLGTSQGNSFDYWPVENYRRLLAIDLTA